MSPTVGRRVVATVIGAPGVGKSRLVAESFARMSGRARILRSRCLPYGDGITYWPVRELVVAAAGIAPGEPSATALAKLDAIVGRLDRGDLVRSRVASIIGLADEPVPGEEIAWAVRRFIEALARMARWSCSSTICSGPSPRSWRPWTTSRTRVRVRSSWSPSHAPSSRRCVLTPSLVPASS